MRYEEKSSALIPAVAIDIAEDFSLSFRNDIFLMNNING